MMLIRLSKNAFVRILGHRAYVENQVNHVSKVFDGKEKDFIACLSRQGQIVGNVAEDAGMDVVAVTDLVHRLEELWFVVTGNSELELSAKETSFSYAEVDAIEKRFAAASLPAGLETVKDAPWLRSLQLEITSSCNERCVHCYIPAESKSTGVSMPIEKVKAVIDEFAGMGGLRIILSGGELFMHKDAADILRYCRAKDLMIFLQSNLTLVDDEMVELIKELNVFNVQVSLYSTDEHIHDMITRVKGSWQKTKTNLEKLVARNIPALISCPLLKQNYKGYRSMMEYARSLHMFCYFDYILLAQNDFCTGNLCTRMTLEQTGELIDEILDTDPAYDAKMQRAVSEQELDGVEFVQRFNKCAVLKNSICVSANGDVYPCPAWQQMYLGNVFKGRLSYIWNSSPRVRELRKINARDFKKCSQCSLYNYCDMCMVYNYNENNGNVEEVCSRFCDVAAMLRSKIHSRYNKAKSRG